ncbi:MAG: LysR family transcriptional regulator [Mesorhizobium sp.]|nr:MAG: LysR family transcriptional regulator [Mesorhizobium sp.]
MESRFLETFLLVAELGSLAEAARRLAITPAAVAQRMQALEDEFGKRLLVRAGRVVQPTDAGHAILEQSRRILGDIRQLKTLAQTDSPSGEMRLGAISTALTGILAPALRHLVDTVPSVEVFVLPGTSTDLYQALGDGSIDAAILVRPPFPIPKSLHWSVLRTEPLILLAPGALATRDPEQLLATLPFIRYDRNNWGGRLADEWLRRQKLRPREWLELDSLEAITVMVSNGLGVSVLPDWAPPWPEGLSVARLPLPGPPLVREIGMLWPRSAPSGRLVRVLLDAFGAVSAGGKRADDA